MNRVDWDAGNQDCLVAGNKGGISFTLRVNRKGRSLPTHSPWNEGLAKIPSSSNGRSGSVTFLCRVCFQGVEQIRTQLTLGSIFFFLAKRRGAAIFA